MLNFRYPNEQYPDELLDELYPLEEAVETPLAPLEEETPPPLPPLFRIHDLYETEDGVSIQIVYVGVQSP